MSLLSFTRTLILGTYPIHWHFLERFLTYCLGYIQERAKYAAEMHVGTMRATSPHQKLFKQVTVM
jgi:MoxR-like ATPase